MHSKSMTSPNLLSRGGTIKLTDERKMAIYQASDNALASFIIIHAALKRSYQIKRYTGRYL